MKQIIIIFFATFFTTFFFRCNQDLQDDDGQKIENTIGADNLSEKKEQKEVDVFCDTTKFPDFQENLALISGKSDKTEYQDTKAREFIDEACSKDSLFCSEINKKSSKSFKYNDEWTIDLIGYVSDQETGMEENSASFFVLTINRNGEHWFSDILSDLMGEIQVTLNGFEDKDEQVRVWGHIYPYFEPDYGKFELTIKNGTGFYDYECHAEH